ncbi:hypothetical protein [Desulfosporosinus youngiae]|uniref:hypothetical protein n=1 Tax=Desulfosporosinus youngiae TaxID=339862 RepID=UPI0012F52B05|nr:hypothetical protein [Desulfosporosinus youngiae]
MVKRQLPEYRTETQVITSGTQPTPVRPKNKRFYMSATLDNTRINREVSRLVDEVISHLTAINGSKVEITLEVNTEIKDGVSTPTVRTVTENCRTLKV